MVDVVVLMDDRPAAQYSRGDAAVGNPALAPVTLQPAQAVFTAAADSARRLGDDTAERIARGYRQRLDDVEGDAGATRTAAGAGYAAFNGEILSGGCWTTAAGRRIGTPFSRRFTLGLNRGAIFGGEGLRQCFLPARKLPRSRRRWFVRER